jgi:hypothetical protein
VNTVRFITIAMLLMLVTACGRDGQRYDVLKDSPEALSCLERGGQLTNLLGNQYCSKSGYFCVMPGEAPPCN